MPDPTENGGTEGDARSIAQRAQDAVDEAMTTEDLDTLFPDGFLDGDPWTLAQIQKDKLPVEVTVALSRAEIPMRTGLPDPRKSGRVAVSHEVAKYEPVPVREAQPDGTKKITKWKIRAHLRATFVEQIGQPEEAVWSEFQKIVLADPQKAQVIADEMVQYAARLGVPVES